jgi:hypothetical protein
MENSMEAPQKTKNRTATSSNNSTLGINPKECNSSYNKDTCTHMFIAELFTITKQWEQPRCPITDEWIKKMWYLYAMEFCSATRRIKFCHMQVSGWNWRTSS